MLIKIVISDYYKAVDRQNFWSFSLTIIVMIGALLIVSGVLLRQFLNKPMSRFIDMVNSYAAGHSDAFKKGIPYSESVSLANVLDEMGDKIESQMLSLQLTQYAVDSRSVAVYWIDLESHITYANDAAIQSTQYSKEELEQMSLTDKDYLNKIQSSANSLLGIIDDILDFSKIEAGKLDLETVEFNLDDVLDNLANLVMVKVQEKENLEVLFATAREIPRFLVGDPLRLGQVLINLVNNAVKFTDSGEIVVSTELLKQDEAGLALKFSVRDTGIGLTEAQIGKLFQSFSQADTSTTRKFGGTGLGLTISKRLVNMMGARSG